MKRVYKTPKAKLVDFTYDEQVVATSGFIADYGDPQQIGRCQQGSATDCKVFWNDSYPEKCSMMPFSLRQIV